MGTRVYLMGDCDDIREQIEFYLLNSDLNALKHFSKSLVEAIEVIKAFAISKMAAEIIYAGGDEIFFYINKDCYQKKFIDDIIGVFWRITGSTISFGVGESVEAAFFNLRRAKSSGKGKIVESEGVRR